MSVQKSLLSYSDCVDYFDTALRFTEGCRIPVPNANFANNLRMRLNVCRKLDRENNQILYPEGHPMHGRSQYDKTVCRIKEENGKVYVVLERIDISRLPVEGIGQELEELPAPPPQLQITGPKVEPEFEELEVVEAEVVEEPKGIRRL